ncbi:MAG TPA: hypothetical protein ENJ82_05035, partial [Bacteroidetes bacterium]|nr:hypothetical protein [Bacteroidota bacterium]
MKSKILMALLCSIAMLTLNSCMKDKLIPNGQQLNETGNDEHPVFKSYQKHGTIVHEALAAGINDPQFRALLKEQSLVKKDGDTEILLSSLLGMGMKSGENVRDFLVKKYNEVPSKPQINRSDLSKFSEKFPSIIVGVRGPVADWATQSHVPTTIFLPLDFKESSTSIPGMKANGEMVDVDISAPFTQVVLTLAPSERHDAQGNLKYDPGQYRQSAPAAVGINDATRHGNGGNVAALLPVEPLTCATSSPNAAINFSATNTASGILLTWSQGSNAQYANLGTWARWVIYRNGTVVHTVYGSEAPSFTDSNLAPFTNYSYSIRFSLVSRAGTCSSPVVYANATSGGSPSRVTDLVDNVQLSTKINLFWNNPSQFAKHHQIDRYNFQTNNWSLVQSNVSPNATSYSYTSYIRGSKHIYRVRTKGATGWSNPTYRSLIAPYRNSGSPMLAWSFYIPNLSSIESPTLGAPELLLTATNGNINPVTQVLGGTLLHNSTFIPLRNCPGSRTNRNYQVSGGSPVHLITPWDYGLYGSVCRVVLVETDQTDPFIDNLTVGTQVTSQNSISSVSPTNGENVSG